MAVIYFITFCTLINLICLISVIIVNNNNTSAIVITTVCFLINCANLCYLLIHK
jgi:hypothetical protein